MSDHDASPYILDVPVDMTALDLNGDEKQSEMIDDGDPYIFIPPNPRSYYRALVKEALSYDLSGSNEEFSGVTDSGVPQIFSKKSFELLSEVSWRWRIPYVSRMLLLLDAAREKFVDSEIDLDTLDAVFNYVKEPPPEKRKLDPALLNDRTKWTIADFALNQQILRSVDDTLLRDLFEEFTHCYEAKPPNIGPIMTVLETHVYDDPLYSRSNDDLNRFSNSLRDALYESAKDQYNFLYESEMGQNKNHVEFFHVIQLGKAVLKFSERIQKRYRKTPRIMG